MITYRRRVLLALARLRAQLPSKAGLRVVTYHGVSLDNCDRWTISQRALEDHLRFLRDSGFRTIRIADIVEEWPEILAQPKVVAVTFDDGRASQHDIAASLLAEYGMTATFFVPTGVIHHDRYALREFDDIMISWKDLRELQQGGFEIGSHSRTHSVMGACSLETARDEIAGSKRELEEQLGTEVVSFAYPKGHHGAYTPRTRELVAAAGYRAACTQTPGAVVAGSDWLELPRVGMAGTDSVRVLEMKLQGAFDFTRLISPFVMRGANSRRIGFPR